MTISNVTASGLARRRHELMLACREAGVKPNPAALEQVAQRIGVTGPTLHRWERGSMRPHLVMLRAWAGVIGQLEAEVARRKERRDAHKEPAS